MTETLELGGNIQLTGFSELEKGALVVVKKIVGSYARKFSDTTSDFQKLAVTAKAIHSSGSIKLNDKFELHAQLVLGGNPINSEITERNLFFALDRVLKKIENNMN